MKKLYRNDIKMMNKNEQRKNTAKLKANTERFCATKEHKIVLIHLSNRNLKIALVAL